MTVGRLELREDEGRFERVEEAGVILATAVDSSRAQHVGETRAVDSPTAKVVFVDATWIDDADLLAAGGIVATPNRVGLTRIALGAIDVVGSRRGIGAAPAWSAAVGGIGRVAALLQVGHVTVERNKLDLLEIGEHASGLKELIGGNAREHDHARKVGLLVPAVRASAELNLGQLRLGLADPLPSRGSEVVEKRVGLAEVGAADAHQRRRRGQRGARLDAVVELHDEGSWQREWARCESSAAESIGKQGLNRIELGVGDSRREGAHSAWRVRRFGGRRGLRYGINKKRRARHERGHDRCAAHKSEGGGGEGVVAKWTHAHVRFLWWTRPKGRSHDGFMTD